MPRPSSGLAGHGPGTVVDKWIAWESAKPGHWIEAEFEARRIAGGAIDDPGILKEIARSIHWRDHGTSYIVDELIGGPFDD